MQTQFRNHVKKQIRYVDQVAFQIKECQIYVELFPQILNRLLVSIIAESKNINKFVESLDRYYDEKLEILSIANIQPNYENLFLKLTDRQKEIIYYAIHHGYFEIPRRINSKKIADHFKISRSALYDHLRKIERTIYQSIFI